MYEFCKLNVIDCKVALWIFDKCPGRLYAFLEYLAEEDYQRQGIKLNARKLFNELFEIRSDTSGRLVYADRLINEQNIFSFNVSD